MKVLKIIAVGATVVGVLGTSAYFWIYTRLPK